MKENNAINVLNEGIQEYKNKNQHEYNYSLTQYASVNKSAVDLANQKRDISLNQLLKFKNESKLSLMDNIDYIDKNYDNSELQNNNKINNHSSLSNLSK